MLKRTKGFVAGFLACAIITTGFAFAKDFSENIAVWYNNIKIYIDGTEITPKDANGNIVEPFTYNGTTYLPVRAIASAFGKDVVWDGETQSVFLGKKDENAPDEYLHRIQYNDYKEKDSKSSMSIIKNTISDVDGKVYTNGLLFYRDYNDGIEVYYPLNSQYKRLKGNIVLPKDKKTSPTDVYFYGDDELLYKATAVTYSMPFKFDIDLKGINQLRIVVRNEEYYSYTALTDLALYKK